MGQPNKELASTKKRSGRRWGLLAVTAGIIILLGSYVGWKVVNSNNGAKAPCSERSDNSLLVRASAATKNVQLDEQLEVLEPITKEISSLAGYRDDSNCLYPIVKYQILSHDFEQAKQTFREFKSVYGDGSSFANDLYQMGTIEDLESWINLLSETSKDFTISNGSMFMAAPESDE